MVHNIQLMDMHWENNNEKYSCYIFYSINYLYYYIY